MTSKQADPILGELLLADGEVRLNLNFLYAMTNLWKTKLARHISQRKLQSNSWAYICRTKRNRVKSIADFLNWLTGLRL